MLDQERISTELKSLEDEKRDLKQGASAGNKERLFTDKLKKVLGELAALEKRLKELNQKRS